MTGKRNARAVAGRIRRAGWGTACEGRFARHRDQAAARRRRRPVRLIIEIGARSADRRWRRGWLSDGRHRHEKRECKDQMTHWKLRLMLDPFSVAGWDGRFWSVWFPNVSAGRGGCEDEPPLGPAVQERDAKARGPAPIRPHSGPVRRVPHVMPSRLSRPQNRKLSVSGRRCGGYGQWTIITIFTVSDCSLRADVRGCKGDIT